MDDLLKYFVGNSFFSRSFFADGKICVFFVVVFFFKHLIVFFCKQRQGHNKKTMQKEVNVTRLFGLRPCQIHWLIFFGG